MSGASWMQKVMIYESRLLGWVSESAKRQSRLWRLDLLGLRKERC